MNLCNLDITAEVSSNWFLDSKEREKFELSSKSVLGSKNRFVRKTWILTTKFDDLTLKFHPIRARVKFGEIIDFL
jgi:hypothetical protein